MKTASLELSKKLQALGAWEGRPAGPGPDTFLRDSGVFRAGTVGFISDGEAIIENRAGIFLPTLPDLLDALDSLGYWTFQLWIHADADEPCIFDAFRRPGIPEPFAPRGHGATIEDAVAACLVVALEAEGAETPLPTVEEQGKEHKGAECPKEVEE